MVTGASGRLGRTVIRRLIARGSAPSDLVAGVRDPSTVTDLTDLGVGVVHLDLDRATTIPAALESIDRVLFISLPEIQRRAARQRPFIEAAARVTLDMLVYTSVLYAPNSKLPMASEHAATEELIRELGVPSVILRNGWYNENYLHDLDQARITGELTAAAGAGRVASASIEDYADAAAAILISENHQGRVYELAGDTSWTYDKLATIFSDVLGFPIAYRCIRNSGNAQAGGEIQPEVHEASLFAQIDSAISQGALESSDRALAALIGRPTTPIAQTLRELASNQPKPARANATAPLTTVE